MANRKATMTDLRVIIREFAKGTPLREIERRLGISRTSLRPYKERAEQSGKSIVNRNDECTENGKLSAQKTVTTVHKNQ